MTVVLIELHFDSARLLTDVLEGIGHEIVHHLLHLALVEPALYAWRRRREREGDRLGARHIIKRHRDVLDKLHEVVLAHTQMGIALLHLAEVEQFVDEFEYHARILIDTLQASGYSGALLYILHHIVELGNDERERRAELVR